MQNHEELLEVQESSNAPKKNNEKSNDSAKIRVNQINATALAYLGDSVFEVYIREHLINNGIYKVDRLHNKIRICKGTVDDNIEAERRKVFDR